MPKSFLVRTGREFSEEVEKDSSKNIYLFIYYLHFYLSVLFVTYLIFQIVSQVAFSCYNLSFCKIFTLIWYFKK